MATSASGGDPALNIALAFREMAENAQRISEVGRELSERMAILGEIPYP